MIVIMTLFYFIFHMEDDLVLYLGRKPAGDDCVS